MHHPVDRQHGIDDTPWPTRHETEDPVLSFSIIL